MRRSLELLLERTKNHKMTPAEREAQRRDFAYGNLHFEDPTVTREMIDEAAEIVNAERHERVANGRRK